VQDLENLKLSGRKVKKHYLLMILADDACPALRVLARNEKISPLHDN